MRKELTDDELLEVKGGLSLKEELDLDKLQYLYSIVNPETYEELLEPDDIWMDHIRKR